jgi:hypothetical protein
VCVSACMKKCVCTCVCSCVCVRSCESGGDWEHGQKVCACMCVRACVCMCMMCVCVCVCVCVSQTPPSPWRSSSPSSPPFIPGRTRSATAWHCCCFRPPHNSECSSPLGAEEVITLCTELQPSSGLPQVAMILTHPWYLCLSLSQVAMFLAAALPVSSFLHP